MHKKIKLQRTPPLSWKPTAKIVPRTRKVMSTQQPNQKTKSWTRLFLLALERSALGARLGR